MSTKRLIRSFKNLPKISIFLFITFLVIISKLLPVSAHFIDPVKADLDSKAKLRSFTPGEWFSHFSSVENYVSSKALELVGPYRNFEIQDLTKLIEDEKPERISELIALLPPSFSSVRVRTYNSRSLQCGTDKSPRIIFFNFSGSLYCSFNSGNPDDYVALQKNSPVDCNLTLNQLECMARDQNFQMRAHSFEFKPEKKFARKFKNLESGFSEEPDFILGQSVKHYLEPQICNDCHFGSTEKFPFNSSRIIFDQYFIWPGMDRSMDDNENTRGVPLSNDESMKSQRFKLTRLANPRYKNLPKRLDQLAKENGLSPASTRLNLNFTQTQLGNNQLRMAQILSHFKNISKFQPLLFALSRMSSPLFIQSSHGKMFANLRPQCFHRSKDKTDFDGYREVPRVPTSEFSKFFPPQFRGQVKKIFEQYYKKFLRSGKSYVKFIRNRVKETLTDGLTSGRMSRDDLHDSAIPSLTTASEYYFFMAALFTIYKMNGYSPDQLTGVFNGQFIFSQGAVHHAKSAFQDWLRAEFAPDDESLSKCDELILESQKLLSDFK